MFLLLYEENCPATRLIGLDEPLVALLPLKHLGTPAPERQDIFRDCQLANHSSFVSIVFLPRMPEIDFVSAIYKKTKRDYLGRVNEFLKAEAAKIAKLLGNDYSVGARKVSY